MDLTIGPEPVDGPPARALLQDYAQELRAEFGLSPQVGNPLGDGLGPPGGLFLVARAGDEPAGCAGLRTLGPGTGELKRMYVRPAYRGLGLAGRLLLAVEQAAQDRQLHRLRLDTAAGLEAARRLYRRSGFQDVDAYNDNPDARHWMEKALGATG